MGDLFDNNMVRNALKSMTPEQLEYYQKIGEQMYNTVDFEKNKILDIAPSDEEMLNYIKCSLNSGLLPCDLEEGEQAFLTNMYGEKWYENFGFSSLGKKEEVSPIKQKRNEKCKCLSGKKYKNCCG